MTGLVSEAQATFSRQTRYVRLVLLGSGVLLLVTGVVTCLAPHAVAVSAPALIGYTLLCGATLELVQMVLAALRDTQSRRANAPMWGAVALHMTAAAVLILWPKISVHLLAIVLLGTLAAEGGVMVYVGTRLRHAPARFTMFLSGLASLLVAIVMLWKFGQPESARWVGVLLGIKCVLLALLLCHVALLTSDDDIRAAYVGLAEQGDLPELGSVYAVFYGPAFHCGIAVGNDQIVDYLTDGVVRLISWDEFRLGRQAMRWNYPDVVPAPPERITQFARTLVGQQTKYNALEFNCENLAIYCRSGGHTCSSRYAQAIVGLEMVKRYPWLGSMLQLVNRGTSWMLYGLGGPLGNRVGFYLVWLSNMASNWLVVRPLRMESTRPQVDPFFTPGGVAAVQSFAIPSPTQRDSCQD